MSKIKLNYSCQSCAARFPKWIGQCTECGGWNSLVEEPIDSATYRHPRMASYAAEVSQITLLADVSIKEQSRLSTGLLELDRVLGGGLVVGSVVLIGGDPGIGKSTLLTQATTYLAQTMSVLYITGEESLAQVALRARRLNLPEDKTKLLAETHIERILAIAEQEKPQAMVIDSIQTVYTDSLSSTPGSVGQVRESAARLVQFAKTTGTALFLVGHVTKEGALAGPRVLEHMVDTVLYFEGEQDSRFRVIRAVKNRFGAVNELGIFAMTDKGLKEVSNPSAIFLSRPEQPVPGSVIMVTWEGSRPMLVEVQGLVDESHLGNPRRLTIGLEQNRLAMLLAVLHGHGGIATYDQDVFLNVVGGIRVLETAADLSLLFAVVSSLRKRVIPSDMVIFGEVGLGGEIRPVQSGQERLREAAKHGFKRAIIPKANSPRSPLKEMEVLAVNTLREALAAIF